MRTATVANTAVNVAASNVMKKKKIDTIIEKILALKEKEAEIKTELAALTKEITSQYKLDANVPEIVAGKVYQATKYCRDNGKNDFKVDVVETYLDALPEAYRGILIETKRVVNADVMNLLGKQKILTAEQMENARNHKYITMTKYEKKPEKIKKNNDDNIIVLNPQQ